MRKSYWSHHHCRNSLGLRELYHGLFGCDNKSATAPRVQPPCRPENGLLQGTPAAPPQPPVGQSTKRRQHCQHCGKLCAHRRSEGTVDSLGAHWTLRTLENQSASPKLHIRLRYTLQVR